MEGYCSSVFSGFCKNKKATSAAIKYSGGEIDVKDIRLMFEMYKKQNINYMESLFTSYYWINDAYEVEIKYLRNRLADRLAYAYPTKAAESFVGMAAQKVRKIEKSYTGKHMANLVQLSSALENYIKAVEAGSIISYKEIIKAPVEAKVLKSYEFNNAEEWQHKVEDMKNIYDTMKRQLGEFLLTYKEPTDIEAFFLLDSLKEDILVKHFKAELANYPINLTV